MGLKKHSKVIAALAEAQEARTRRLEIRADLVVSKYFELMGRAQDAKDFETALQALTQLYQRLRIFERHQALPLLEIMEQAPNDWKVCWEPLLGCLRLLGSMMNY